MTIGVESFVVSEYWCCFLRSPPLIHFQWPAIFEECAILYKIKAFKSKLPDYTLKHTSVINSATLRNCPYIVKSIHRKFVLSTKSRKLQTLAVSIAVNSVRRITIK